MVDIARRNKDANKPSPRRALAFAACASWMTVGTAIAYVQVMTATGHERPPEVPL